MNSLLEAISALNLYLKDNNNTKTHSTIILSEKKNNTHTIFGHYDLNKNKSNNKNNTPIHICKLYNLQKHTNYCNACNANKNYLLKLHKIAYLKKNSANKLCIELRKKFDKISKLEELYKTETENYTNYKELLKTNPSIYNEAKLKLAYFNKKKKKIQKQIILEKNKILATQYKYIILLTTIDV
jgi:hypothetical protein